MDLMTRGKPVNVDVGRISSSEGWEEPTPAEVRIQMFKNTLAEWLRRQYLTGNLTHAQYTALALLYIRGFSQRRSARVLGISQPAMCGRAQYGIESIRNIIERDFPGLKEAWCGRS